MKRGTHAYFFFLLVCLDTVNDGETQLRDDLALGGHLNGHGLAGLDGTDTARGASQDHISLLKLHDGGNIFDQGGDPMKEREAGTIDAGDSG